MLVRIADQNCQNSIDCACSNPPQSISLNCPPGRRHDGAGVLRSLEPAHVGIVVLRHRAEAAGEVAELSAGRNRCVAARPAAHADIRARRDVPSIASRAE